MAESIENSYSSKLSSGSLKSPSTIYVKTEKFNYLNISETFRVYKPKFIFYLEVDYDEFQFSKNVILVFPKILLKNFIT